MNKKSTFLEEDHLPSLKFLAIVSFVLLLCGAALFPFDDGGIMTYIREYEGLIWHLSMFFFINKLPTPEWGRKAGTYWVLIDVLSGLLYLNNFYSIMGDASLGIATEGPYQICYIIRLCAHVFEGIWLISSACTTDNKVIKVSGICAGVLLGGYSLISPFAPAWMLSLNMPFVIVWFIMIVLGKYTKKSKSSKSH